MNDGVFNNRVVKLSTMHFKQFQIELNNAMNYSLRSILIFSILNDIIV